MKRFFPFLFCAACLCACSEQRDADDLKIDAVRAAIDSYEEQSVPDGAQILCVDEALGRVVIFDAKKNWNSPDAVVWQWYPAEAPEIPEADKKFFRNLSDAKPVFGTSHILFNSSMGAVGLLRVSDKKLLFYGIAAQWPHSCAMLPDGNVVAVSSRDAKITLFSTDPSPTNPKTPKAAEYDFFDAHGIVWDSARKALWVLGGRELGLYAYNFDKKNPKLKKIASHKLPQDLSGGHDLYPLPNSDLLFITGMGVGIFDPSGENFSILDREIKSVKSISQHPQTDAIIIQKADEKWYADNIKFYDRAFAEIGECKGSKFYKARWFVPNDFSQ